MNLGDLPANADLSQVLAPLVEPIVPPLVLPIVSDYCLGTDARLSDARTPLPHEHDAVYAAIDHSHPPSGGLWTRVALSVDRTNNNAVANTLQDVTGLSFPVVAGQRYWFRFYIIYTAQATTTGSRWTLNGPAFTGLSYMSEYSLTGTTTTRNAQVIAYNSPAASNATSAATGPSNVAQIEGFIQPSANGTLIARFASEVANSAIIAKVGSFVEYTQV